MKEQKKNNYSTPVIEVIIMDLKDSIATSGAGKKEEFGLWDII